MNAELTSDTKQVEVLHVKWVTIKLVTISVLVVKQKQGKQCPERPQCGKDGRVIANRKAANSGKAKREQLWPKENMEKAFRLWEENKDLPPDKRLSKRQIAITCEIPYTSVCERLSGRHGVGKTGKIAGGKRRG